MSDEALVIDLDQPEGKAAAPAANPPAEDEYGAPIQAQQEPGERKKPEEGIEDLAQQKADLEARLASERAAREAAEARANDSSLTAHESLKRVANSDLQQVLASKEVLERDAKDTRDAYRTAMEQGDFDAAAQAQEKMAQLAIQRTRLNSAEQQIKHYIENPQPQPKITKAPPDPATDLEGYLSTLTKPTADWLRRHPIYATNPAKNTRAMAAHMEAIDNKIVPDTPEYFAFVEKELGITSQQSKAQERVAEESPNPPPAAPVSRGNSNSSTTLPQERQITLTAEQVAMARDMDMTPREYALHLAALRSEGKMGRTQS